MNITLLGATGRTGRILLPLLVAEHQVTVLARRPQAIEVPRSNVAVITGCATDRSVVSEAVRHAEIVISLISPSANSPIGVRSESTRALVHALQDLNPYARLVVVTVLGGRASITQLPWFARWHHKRAVGTELLADVDRQEAMVGDSGLVATIVRPPRLDDRPATGARTADDGVPHGAVLHRADLARFLADGICPRLPALETVTVVSAA